MRFAVWTVAAIALIGAFFVVFVLENFEGERRKIKRRSESFPSLPQREDDEKKKKTGAAVADLFSVSPQMTGDLSALATGSLLGYGAWLESKILDAEAEGRGAKKGEEE